MKEIKDVEEFLDRVKRGLSVSRFVFRLGFKWSVVNSKVLRSADLSFADLSSADLSSADLRSADLSFADLSSADLSSADLRSVDLSFVKGTFFFNYGVKLKVVPKNEC